MATSNIFKKRIGVNVAELSVVLTTINDSIATNMTMAQIIQQCEQDEIDYEIILVDNGDEAVEKQNLEAFLNYHKDFPIKYFEYPSPRGTIPPHSFGVLQASGKYLTMPDPHMVFCRNYFSLLLDVFKVSNIDGYEVVFTPFSVGAISRKGQGYIGGSDLNYPNPFQKVNGIGFGVQKDYGKIPILVNSLSSMILSKEWMLKIGNMFPEAFEIAGGYCAESMLIGLTTWMFGGKCLLYKGIIVDHPVYCASKPGGRNTSMHLSMATGAYILGGEKYLTEIPLGYGEYPEEQLKQIKILAASAREYVQKNAKYSLDELMENWEKIKNG